MKCRTSTVRLHAEPSFSQTGPTKEVKAAEGSTWLGHSIESFSFRLARFDSYNLLFLFHFHHYIVCSIRLNRLLLEPINVIAKKRVSFRSAFIISFM
jgi:hypothetical protein